MSFNILVQNYIFLNILTHVQLKRQRNRYDKRNPCLKKHINENLMFFHILFFKPHKVLLTKFDNEKKEKNSVNGYPY